MPRDSQFEMLLWATTIGGGDASNLDWSAQDGTCDREECQEALLLIGSQADIVVSKALVGLTYVAVSVPIFLLVTRMPLSKPLLFTAAVLALTATLVAFGLLLARTVSQLNTWSSFPLLVLIMPAFLGLIGLPAWAQFILDATPGTQAMRMLVDSASVQPVYGSWPISWAVVAGWGVVGYVLLIRSLAAREA